MREIGRSTQTVTVVGLGKIGLALAAVFSNNGYCVIGADVNSKVVSMVNKGISHIRNEPGLDDLVRASNFNRTLTATINTTEAVSKSDIVVVIVPVIITDNNDVDYRYIDAAVESIAVGIQRGALIIFETTLPTGDTRNRFGKKIEELSGLEMGIDFYLAYSPERVYSNRIIQDLKKYPKVIGAVNEESLNRASAFYEKALACELIQMSSLESAEFSKVAESVYRDVNIALANELAIYADKMGVNFLEVIQAGNSQPFSHLHSPGLGVGGHCIPVYPYFFIKRGLANGIVQASRERNDRMADYGLSLIEDNVGGTFMNLNVLILGLSFRENVKETTKSSTLLLIDLLKKRRASVYVHDPLYEDEEIASYGITPFSFDSSTAGVMDVVILQAFHDQYKNLNWDLFTNCTFVLDGRNALDQDAVQRRGIKYKGIGK